VNALVRHLRVLVACEFSGVVRDAFRAAGDNAWSCDLLPCDVDGPHYRRNVLELMECGWDLMIAHPPPARTSASAGRVGSRTSSRSKRRRWSSWPNYLPRQSSTSPLKTPLVSFRRGFASRTRLFNRGSLATEKQRQRVYGSRTCRRLLRPRLLQAGRGGSGEGGAQAVAEPFGSVFVHPLLDGRLRLPDNVVQEAKMA